MINTLVGPYLANVQDILPQGTLSHLSTKATYSNSISHLIFRVFLNCPLCLEFFASQKEFCLFLLNFLFRVKGSILFSTIRIPKTDLIVHTALIIKQAENP